MFNRILESRYALLIAGVSALCVVATTGCSGGEGTASKPTPQGTIAFEQVKVGMPESTFKDAILTFSPDPNGTMSGKVQYLSRANNADGGQYIVQCKDDRCYELQVIYSTQPISKDTALKALHALLPESVPPQSKDDDSQVKAKATAKPTEVIWFGDDYRGEIVYADKTGDQVFEVNAWYQPKQTAAAPDGSSNTTPSN